MAYIINVVVTMFLVLLFSCGKNNLGNNSNGSTPVTVQKPPVLKGRLVFHSYSCYSCNDSKLFMLDFSTGVLTQINTGWNIDDCMNADFSPDGKYIVFMGTDKVTGNWDVYLWLVNSAAQPVNLTAALGASSRDEDPKFSNSGTRIVFKHNGHLAEMDLSGNITRTITGGSGEESMPYYIYNDSKILYAEGGGAGSDIYMVDKSGVSTKTEASLPNIQEYYPIGKDSVSFLYTGGLSATSANDQIFRGFYDKSKIAQYLPFNEPSANYSDPYPCNDEYVFLSSTRTGTKGGYDLYLADIKTGNIWSLNVYNLNVNSANEELGSCYNPN
ncbi:hypothetical protein [uncultured Mucilaginibacter sp.]|uniref:hypothetical protein n=1 Tax=uncultured Mucilaginibacter sp. TaxID=797541 RepID=UPI0025D5C148|nr:hypothetical protein [uncultured Mucilaginibacter sp.]